MTRVHAEFSNSQTTARCDAHLRRHFLCTILSAHVIFMKSTCSSAGSDLRIKIGAGPIRRDFPLFFAYITPPTSLNQRSLFTRRQRGGQGLRCRVGCWSVLNPAFLSSPNLSTPSSASGMPPPVTTVHSTQRETSSTHLIEPPTTTPRSSTPAAASTHSPTTSGSGSLNLGDSSSTTTPVHSSTTSRRVHSSRTTWNAPSQSSPPLSHDTPSHGVPTSAIVAAAAVSGILIIGIIYKLWLIRSRRRNGQYGTTPLPPPRGSVIVQSTSTSGAGYQYPTNSATVNSKSNSATTQQIHPSEESERDEYYSNHEPLESPAPALPEDRRPVSWISFDGKSAPRPTLSVSPPNAFLDRPLSPNPLPDPFSSSDDVNKRSDPESIQPVHGPGIHGDQAAPSPLDDDDDNDNDDNDDDDDNENDDDEGGSVVTSDPTAAATLTKDDALGPLPSYPSLPTASSSTTHESSTVSSIDGIEYPLRPPGRQPRSPPPQAAPASSTSQQPTYPNLNFNSAQSPRQSSYLRNSIYQPSPSPSPLPPPIYDPYPSSSSLLDRRVSYASSVHTHRSGGARSARHYPTSGGIPRGAPHLPHVRAAVEIVLPTPLAPQMSGSNVPMYAVGSGPSSSSSHAYPRRDSTNEVGGVSGTTDAARQWGSRAGSQIRRASSRLSTVGTDPWADATLSARHQESSSANASSDGDRAQIIRTGSQSSKNSRSKSQSRRPASPPAPPVPAGMYNFQFFKITSYLLSKSSANVLAV